MNTSNFSDFPQRYLNRPWTSLDGISDADLDARLTSVAYPIPLSLRRFYEQLGRCTELLAMYNEILPVEDLEWDSEHLIFAHENQDVVSWGFRREDLHLEDPMVWQRVNDGSDAPPWYSEDLSLEPFLTDMFDWVVNNDTEDE